MAKLYASRAGVPTSVAASWLAEEREFIGAEAVAVGLADALLPEEAVVVSQAPVRGAWPSMAASLVATIRRDAAAMRLARKRPQSPALADLKRRVRTPSGYRTTATERLPRRGLVAIGNEFAVHRAFTRISGRNIEEFKG